MNSTNIKVISEEIQRLKDKVHAIDVEVPDPSQATDGQILSVDDGKYVISDPELPAVTAASTGDVLGLVGEAKTPGWITPFTPADYSETETATGQKWIDGKDVYCKVINGRTSETQNTNVEFNLVFNTMIHLGGMFTNEYGYGYDINKVLTVNTNPDKTKIVVGTGIYIDRPITILVYYTKPSPTREQDEEPETKSTKKKTTKKGE